MQEMDERTWRDNMFNKFKQLEVDNKILKDEHRDLQKFTKTLQDSITPRAVKILIKLGVKREVAEFMWSVVKYMEIEVMVLIAFLEYTQTHDWTISLFKDHHREFIVAAAVTVPFMFCCFNPMLLCLMAGIQNVDKSIAICEFGLGFSHIFSVAISYLGIAAYVSLCDRSIVIQVEVSTAIILSLAIIHWIVSGKRKNWAMIERPDGQISNEVCCIMSLGLLSFLASIVFYFMQKKTPFIISLALMGYCLLLSLLSAISDKAEHHSQEKKSTPESEKAAKEGRTTAIFLSLHITFFSTVLIFCASLHGLDRAQ